MSRGDQPRDLPDFLGVRREPDFSQLVTVLRRGRPERATQFEFHLHHRLTELLAGRPRPALPRGAGERERRAWLRDLTTFLVEVSLRVGYDFVLLPPDAFFPGFEFQHEARHHEHSYSLNEVSVIPDRAAFERHVWPELSLLDAGRLDEAERALPAGMKGIVYGPFGVLENLIHLVGYDRLCYLMADDPEVVRGIAEKVGAGLLEFYRRAAAHPAVGAIIANDDWGFKGQTMLSPADLRSLVFPWHRQIARVAHEQGKPVILHSCGNLRQVMDDVIDDIGIDGRHSYEDTIQPVEEAYEEWGRRISIIGGIDLDFLCTATPEAVSRRARAMLERSAGRGGYALGSGNSIPEYVPEASYLAMVGAARG